MNLFRQSEEGPIYRGPNNSEFSLDYELTDQQYDAIRRATYWGETLKPINDWFDKSLAALSKQTYKERKEAMGEFHREFKEMSGRVEKFNPLDSSLGYSWTARAMMGTVTPEYSRRIGLGFVQALMPSWEGAAYWQDRVHIHRELTKLAVALAVFKAQRGQYPEGLAELEPDYIDQLPEDLFTGEPLKYQAREDGYVLYSVGPSMTDHGGSDDKEQGHDDIVIRVPLAEQ